MKSPETFGSRQLASGRVLQPNLVQRDFGVSWPNDRITQKNTVCLRRLTQTSYVTLDFKNGIREALLTRVVRVTIAARTKKYNGSNVYALITQTLLPFHHVDSFFDAYGVRSPGVTERWSTLVGLVR